MLELPKKISIKYNGETKDNQNMWKYWFLQEGVMNVGDGFIKTDDLTIGSFTGGEKYIDATLNGAVEIYHNDVKALSTSSTGINVWGNSGNGILDIYPTGSAVYAILNLHNVSGGSAYNAQLISTSGQSVYLGSGGTGEVVLRTGNSQNKVRGVHNGQVELFYSSSKKLETTNTGIYVYGCLLYTSPSPRD